MDPNQPTMPQQPMSQAQQVPQMPTPEVFPASHRMRNFLFILLTIIIAGGLVAGAYYLGARQNQPVSMQQNVPTATPSPTQSAQALPTVLPTSTTSTIVTGGGISGLKKYSLTLPDNWNVSREQQSFGGSISTEKLVFSRENNILYSFTILQGGGDGGPCSYPDNKITSGIVSGDYTVFTSFKDKDGVSYRRGLNGDNADKTGLKYTVCQLGKEFYSNLTTYGWITYNTPKNPDAQILSEMDSVLASLKTQ